LISIGADLNGPGLEHANISKLIAGITQAVVETCGPWIGSDDFGPCGSRPASGPYFEVGSEPSINVVFYVPGSFGDFDVPKIEACLFSRKNKALLIAVPVPKDAVESGGSVEFVIGALHEANRIAAESFAKKKLDGFNFDKAESLVEEVRKALVERGFH
jgi:hypothetical protein